MLTTETTKSDEAPPCSENVVFDMIDEKDPYFFRGRRGNFLSSGFPKLFEAYTPNSKGSHSEWKDFQHYKRSAESTASLGEAPCTTDYWTGAWSLSKGTCRGPYLFYSGQFGAPGEHNLGLPVFYASGAAGGFVPSPSAVAELYIDSLRSMLPYIKPELSLLNSIFELKDFRSLPAQVRSIKALLKGDLSLLKHWGINSSVWKLVQKCPLGQTLREHLRETASGYLQYKFNLAPLISDISAVHRALSQSERRINDLLTRSAKTRKCHYMRHFQEFSAFSYDETDWVGIGEGGSYWATDVNDISGLVSYERDVRTEPTTFHAEIEYNYNYTRFQEANALLFAKLDALGVNFNPRIIWNAIPWSFVVDWFVDVNQRLNDLRGGLMDPMINIHRYCWSVKRSRQITVRRKLRWRQVWGGPIDAYPTTVALPSVRETSYKRSISTPTAASLQASGLNSQEFTLGAALVLSRRRHRRPKH